MRRPTTSRVPRLSELGQNREAALRLTPVSAATVARLDRFVERLLIWQSRINLVAPSTLPELWTRHVADSLQLVPLAGGARTWVDLGSGGGFPGLVIACWLADQPGGLMYLIESNGKKAAFLRETARDLGLGVKVHHARIADCAAELAGTVEIVTARALAPLSELMGLAEPFLKKGAQGLFPKGQDVGSELTETSKYWRLDASLEPSRTDPRGRIVVVRSAERRPSVL